MTPGPRDGNGPSRGLIAAVVLGAVLAGFLVYFAPVDYTAADSRGALLTAQSILEGHRGDLGAYQPVAGDLGYRVQEIEGRLTYIFPPGSSYLALPAVAMARAVGADYRSRRDDRLMQRVLAALVVSSLTVLLVGLALRHGPWAGALMFVAVVTSPITSTLGTAYWSAGPALVTLVLAVVIASARISGSSRLPLTACGVPALLAVAWVTRPTMALPGVIVWAILLFREGPRRRSFVVCTGVSVVAALICLRVVTGSWMPAYFSGARISSPLSPEAALGHLVSPSRGLLVYCPQLLLLIPLLGAMERSRRNAIILAAGGLWMVGHWVAVSRFEHWWGGHGFGPRLMTEVYVAALLLAVLVDYRSVGRAWRRAFVGIAAATLAFAAYAHVGKGLYDRGSADWNQYPVAIDSRPERLWRWSEAQFLASESALDRQRFEAQLSALRRASVGEYYDVESGRIAALPFRPPLRYEGRAYALTASGRPRLVCAAPVRSVDPASGDRIRMMLAVGSAEATSVSIFAGDQVVARAALEDFAPVDIQFDVPLRAIRERSSGPPVIELDLRTESPPRRREWTKPLWRRARYTISVWGLRYPDGGQ